jgi:phage-related minor tail protein
MGIKLTEEESRLVKEGKLDVNNIEEHRKLHPVRTINVNEVDAIKQEIRDANILYQQSIQRNKDLYKELEESRKKKEECRNKIAELRIKKKQLLGLEE